MAPLQYPDTSVRWDRLRAELYDCESHTQARIPESLMLHELNKCHFLQLLSE